MKTNSHQGTAPETMSFQELIVDAWLMANQGSILKISGNDEDAIPTMGSEVALQLPQNRIIYNYALLPFGTHLPLKSGYSNRIQ